MYYAKTTYEFICKYTLPWLEHVHSTLNKLGLTYLQQRKSVTVDVFETMIKRRLKDQYLQTWNDEKHNNNLCHHYRLFKSDFRFECYLKTLKGPLLNNMLRLKFSNHRLPIHSRRFLNVPRCERVCELCERLESQVMSFIIRLTVGMKELLGKV